ncbi:MAG: TonB-dependent receptor plug domain-containing protein, partial [Bryobacteraceae bacterium]
MRTSRKRPGKTKARGSTRKETFWPVTYKWIAMGTLVAYSALGGKTVVLAETRDTRGLWDAANSAGPGPAHPPTVRQFAIAAGKLDAVLAEFERLTQIHLEAKAPGILLLDSPGVQGTYTVDAALEHLLAGTHVKFRFTAPCSVLLELSGPNETVEVVAQPTVIASPKYTEPILNTPQTIDVVPQQVMEQQGATTLRDVLRNVAGLSLAAGEGGSQGDNLTIRGFSARNDIFLDGMRDFGSYYRDPFNYQEVEVLQGPSAVNYGRGTTGGVVSQASK